MVNLFEEQDSLSMLLDFVSDNYYLFGVQSSCCLWSKIELFHMTFPDSSSFTKAEEVSTRREDTGTIFWLFTSPVHVGF